MLDNYTEETQPLFKLLRTPAFRFVVVRFNHYSLVKQLQSDLRAQFADRKVSIINTEKATYQEILKTYLDQEEGFLFLENFEDILKRDADSQGKVSPEMAKNNQRRSSIAAGLNMRRDKLAKYPIAIVAFVFASAGELYARSLMEKMPDLWSFRSLLLDLKQEQEASTAKKIQQELQWEPTPVSTLGGNTREEKLSELNRLLNEVKATPNTETNYLRTLYEQIAELQKETGQYDEAIKTINSLIEKTEDPKFKFGFLISMGDLLRTRGFFDNALKIFIEAKHYCKKIEEDYPLGIVHQRLGDNYVDLEISDKALSNYQQALSIMQKLHQTFPYDKIYADGLSISLFKLGNIYQKINQLDTALDYYFKGLELSGSLYNSDKGNISYKNGIAISNSKIGDIFFLLKEFDRAIVYYEIALSIFKELYKIDRSKFQKALAINYLKLGDTYFTLGNRTALSHFKTGEKLFQELSEQDKSNLDKKNDLAFLYYKLGNSFYDKQNDLQTAKTYFKQAQKLWEELVATSPNHAEFKKNLEQVKKDLASLSE
jgi:tetratricopeptide (TPR) repeat protein